MQKLCIQFGFAEEKNVFRILLFGCQCDSAFLQFLSVDLD